jgi:hypothetical protein
MLVRSFKLSCWSGDQQNVGKLQTLLSKKRFVKMHNNNHYKECKRNIGTDISNRDTDQ